MFRFLFYHHKKTKRSQNRTKLIFIDKLTVYLKLIDVFSGQELISPWTKRNLNSASVKTGAHVWNLKAETRTTQTSHAEVRNFNPGFNPTVVDSTAGIN